jgi:LPXTG-site transpeptidase (sortase) family protein
MNSFRQPNRRHPLRWLIGLFIVLLAVIGFFVFQFVQQSTPVAAVPTSERGGNPNPPTVTPGGPTMPSTVYRIVSEKANLSTQITQLYFATTVDNWDLTYLGGLAGHLQGTADLGTGGNFVLAGHVELKDGSQGPFARIHTLQAGDTITLFGNQQPNPNIVQYEVTDVLKVAPTDFTVMRNHGYEELTLITCDDWDQQGKAYKTRVVVHARPSYLLARLTQTAAVTTPTRAPTLTATPRR